ncbi:MAG: hypothetical protein N4A76_16710 [Firmicutes bacterium]|jgi:hypothetical protein|nr:hypothetical protein [Bacillota bacterium]
MGSRKIITIGIIFIVGVVLLVKGLVALEMNKNDSPGNTEENNSSTMLTITKEIRV